MKIQNIIKVLWKIKFGGKISKQWRAPTVMSSKWPLEVASQRGTERAHLWCGAAAPFPTSLRPPLLQQLLAVALIPFSWCFESINPESSGVSPHSLSTLHFHSLSLSLAPPLAKIFSTKLKCKETL